MTNAEKAQDILIQVDEKGLAGEAAARVYARVQVHATLAVADELRELNVKMDAISASLHQLWQNGIPRPQ